MQSIKSNSTLFCRLSLLLFAATWAVSASAHEQKVALTDILYNERTGNLEIAHRFSVHDAEHALSKVSKSKVDLTQSTKARVAFSKYVADRFELSLDGKTPLKLEAVGQELERGYLWVYQEIKIPTSVDTPFYIKNTILQDAVKGQVNTVNVRYRSKVSTLEFKAGSGSKLYSRAARRE